MIEHRGIILSVFTLALAVIASDVSAQYGGGGMFGGRGGRGMNRGEATHPGNSTPRPAQSEEALYDQTEYRLSLLEEDLHLQPEQRKAWQSFADSVRSYAGDLARERARLAGTSSGVGLQHIEHAVDSARNRLAALEDIAAAAKRLYAALSPEQKTLTDGRIVGIVAPRPLQSGAPASASNLPDLGSSARPR
jgi:hypothetical protein